MTDSNHADALLMARAATTAAIMSDDQALELVLSEEDPELMRRCCETLVGMLSGYIIASAHTTGRDPMEFWMSGVERQVARIGY